MRYAGTALAILIGLAIPAAAQSDEAHPVTRVSADAEAETGDPFRIRIWLDRDGPSPGDIVVGAIELRHLDEAAPPLRPTLHLVDGAYETWVTFEEPGDWEVLLWPDVVDRSALTGIREGPTISVRRGPAGWLGSALLLLLGVGLVAFAVRGKRARANKPKPAPTHGGDTWWWGP